MNENSDNGRLEGTDYSYGNPPPSVMEATQRLDAVDKNIARIEGDLKGKTERDLGTADAYEDWKFRANRALAHRRREKAFLLQWLSYESGRLERNYETLSDNDRRQRLHGMVAEFLKSAPPYGIPIAPGESATLEKVAKRRAELSEFKTEYGAFLTFLKGESFRIHCPLDYYHAARGKVAQLVQKAEAEIFRLKKLSQALAPQAPSDSAPGADFSTKIPDPRPSGDPRLAAILSSLHRIKGEIRMNSSDMTMFLYELLNAQRHLLILSPEQVRILESIDRYVQLTKERRSIEFPR